MSEVINLDEARKERWLRILEDARQTGKVAVFGALQEQEAMVIPFPRISRENVS